jgi:hypothetical protein
MKKNRRAIFYFVEFVKFASGFAAILALALLSLKVAMAAQ